MYETHAIRENVDKGTMTAAYVKLMGCTQWDYEQWCMRRDMIKEVWETKSPKRRKELLALLVMHSNEASCDLSEQE